MHFLRCVYLFGLICTPHLYAHTHPGQNAAEREIVPFALMPNDEFEDHIVLENVFTPEECATIIAYGLKVGPQDASIGSRDELKVSTSIRKSRVAWLGWTQEIAWVFDRLKHHVLPINRKHFHFDLSGFFEKIQFTEYLPPDSHYSWHMDMANKELSLRKLSLVVQLSDPQDYEGGQLEFFAEPIKMVPKKQGSLTLFPSYLYHRVTPITKGKRYTLVVWISGPPYR